MENKTENELELKSNRMLTSYDNYQQKTSVILMEIFFEKIFSVFVWERVWEWEIMIVNNGYYTQTHWLCWWYVMMVVAVFSLLLLWCIYNDHWSMMIKNIFILWEIIITIMAIIVITFFVFSCVLWELVAFITTKKTWWNSFHRVDHIINMNISSRIWQFLVQKKLTREKTHRGKWKQEKTKSKSSSSKWQMLRNMNMMTMLTQQVIDDEYIPNWWSYRG